MSSMPAASGEHTIHPLSCSGTVEAHFGAPVGDIFAVIQTSQPITLQQLIKKAKRPAADVRQAMQILVHYSLIRFRCNERQQVLYYACANQTDNLRRSPLYGCIIRQHFEERGVSIFKDLLYHVRVPISTCVQRLEAQTGESSANLQRTFEAMIASHFVRRVDRVDEETTSKYCPVRRPYPKDEWQRPFDKPTRTELECKQSEPTQSNSRKRPAEEEPDVTKVTYWTLNYRRFAVEMRDMLIVEFIKATIDTPCSLVMKCILRMCQRTLGFESTDATVEVTADSVLRVLRTEKVDLGDVAADDCMKALDGGSRSICTRIGRSSGGLYSISYEKAAQLLVQSSVEYLIDKRYDRRAVRIFNALREKGAMEQTPLERVSMMPNKEGKYATHRMLFDQMIDMRAFSMQPNFEPQKTVYVLRHNANHACDHVRKMALKTMNNLRAHELATAARLRALLVRRDRADAIKQSIMNNADMDEETRRAQMGEVDDAHTTAIERHTLTQYDEHTKQLCIHMANVDRALFTAQFYIEYCTDTFEVDTKRRGSAKAVVKVDRTKTMHEWWG